jgi:hypothetical protein
MSQERNSNKKIDAVGAVLSRYLQEQGLDSRLRRYRAWQVWEEVVGPQIAARARPCRMREDTLEVWVDHAVWMQQLQLMKPKLIARLNAAIGEPLIRDLYLRRGRPQESVPAAPPAPEHDWQKTTLSPEENTRIEQTVAPLADPELRGRLRELLRLQARLAKARQKT